MVNSPVRMSQVAMGSWRRWLWRAGSPCCHLRSPLESFTDGACETGLQFVRVISDSLAQGEKQRLIELGKNTKGILAKATLDISLVLPALAMAACTTWTDFSSFHGRCHHWVLLAPRGLLTLTMQRYQPEDRLS